jgi:membrane protein required for colicin V production
VSDFPVTLFDLAVIAIVLISAALAWHRGLTREILAVAAWIAAGVFAYTYAFFALRPIVGRTIEQSLLADIVTAVVAFVVPLVILKVVFGVLAERVQGSWLGRLDRWGGAAFGLARGVVVVVLLWLVVDLTVAPEERPAWLRDGLLMPYVQDGAEIIAGLLPKETRA